MKLAIFSDVHSNLEAFEAVLEDIKNTGVDRAINLGDLVGYGASPREVIELNQKHVDVTLLGNHDAAVAGMLESYKDEFNYNAVRAVNFCRDKLDDDLKKYLKELPVSFVDDGMRFVHGCPPESWNEYIVYSYFSLNPQEEKVCFVGHVHDLLAYSANGEKGYCMTKFPDSEKLDDNLKYIFCVGSAGQPRDGDKMAKWCSFDTENKEIKIHRVEYDVEKAAKKIIDAGLPEFLAERLKDGR